MQNLSGGRIDDFILRERATCNFLLSLDIGDLQRGGVFIPQRRMICNLPLFILFYIEIFREVFVISRFSFYFILKSSER